MARKRSQPRPSGLRDRIIELRRVVASELVSHPSNWRTHPPAQLAALEGILGEVGIADALLGFPADGKGVVTAGCPLMVFDGHCRKDRDPSQVWPVLVMDLTRAEADKMLAVIDPLATMSEPDEAARQALWDSLVLESQALKAMAPVVVTPQEGEWPTLNETTETSCVLRWPKTDEQTILDFVGVKKVPHNQLGRLILERIKAVAAN